MITVDASNQDVIVPAIEKLLDEVCLKLDLKDNHRKRDDLLQEKGLWLMHPVQMLNYENEGIMVSQLITSAQAMDLSAPPLRTIFGAPVEMNLEMPRQSVFLILNREIVSQIVNLHCPPELF